MSKTIVAIGEALWDIFPDERRPGGAPCNVAFHAAQLGNRGVIITRVGDDPAGTELIAFLRERGVLTDWVQRDPAKPTGTVSVTFDGRDPSFSIAEDVAWDHLVASHEALSAVRAADAVCVGSLAQRSERSRTAVQRLLATARGATPVIFDVNLRPPFVNAAAIAATLPSTTVVKMNEAEVTDLSLLFDQPALVPWLLDEMGVKAVCVTLGGRGAAITTKQGTVTAPSVEIDTTGGDSVGAGDAFAAALIHQVVRQVPMPEALHAANRYAGLVASRRGAMPGFTHDDLARVGLPSLEGNGP